jgi:hypothetical protein
MFVGFWDFVLMSIRAGPGALHPPKKHFLSPKSSILVRKIKNEALNVCASRLFVHLWRVKYMLNFRMLIKGNYRTLIAEILNALSENRDRMALLSAGANC